MKKIIRLTERDLTRIVKRVINEGEEHEERMEHFVGLGFDNLQSYFLSQLDGKTTWDDLFNMYGESVADSLFDNNPNIFMEFILHSMGTRVPFDKVYEHYPKLKYDTYTKMQEMFKYFFNGDMNLFNDFLNNNPNYVVPFLNNISSHRSSKK